MRSMRSKGTQGCVVKKGGWWILRHRQECVVDGKRTTVLRSSRLVRVDANHRTKASVLADRHVRKRIAELTQAKREKVAPETVTTLGEFVDRVYLPYVEQNKRPSTLKGYKDIWKHLKSRCADEWLRDVRTSDVQDWLESIAREDGLSSTSMKHVKHFLGGLFRRAAQVDFYDSTKANPVKAATIPRVARAATETHATELEEVKQMFTVLSEPARTVVAVAAFAGLRLGEIRGLQWENYTPTTDGTLAAIQVTRSIWRSHVGEPKTKRSKASVPVIAPLAKMLEMHRFRCGNPVSGSIFANTLGRPQDLDGLYQREMKSVLKGAGITWHGWHAFRRGLATNLNRLGIADKVIQEILRHSNISTTQNIYIKPTSVDVVAAMQQWEQSEQLRQLESAMFPICSPNCSPNGENVPHRVIN